MYKPNSLRKHLTEAIKDLSRNPTKLLIFADEGNVVARAAGSLSFEYAYKLNLIVTDFVGDADSIMVPLLAWCQVHQLNLLDHPEQRKTGIRFEVDFNSNDSMDVDIKLDLTEIVSVKEGQAGRLDVVHLAEPMRIGEEIDPDKVLTVYDKSGNLLGSWKQPRHSVE